MGVLSVHLLPNDIYPVASINALLFMQVIVVHAEDLPTDIAMIGSTQGRLTTAKESMQNTLRLALEPETPPTPGDSLRLETCSNQHQAMLAKQSRSPALLSLTRRSPEATWIRACMVQTICTGCGF